MSAAMAALAMVWAAAGCVEKETRKKTIDPAYVKKNVLSAPPASIQNPVNADLGGYVTYLGNDVDKATIAPGDKVVVVHYWKVVASPGAEWRVFSHLVGTGDQWMNVDQTDMRLGYPPAQWKPGDIIRDEQTITLDKGWKSSSAQLTVGLYRKGTTGTGDRMRIESGPADHESRVLAFRFAVDRRGAGKPVPPADLQVQIRRASGPIAIDGVASEADWQSAATSPAFSPAEGGREPKGATHARLLWDDAYLYAFVQVEDPDVHSEYKARDESLWKQDVVELFIDADRTRRGYVELQVSPRNVHFDSWFPQTRAQGGHPEWNGAMKSAVVVHGTIDDRDDVDQGWDAEIAIPLADVKGADAAMKVAIPPVVGDRWRLNVVRVDKPKDDPLAASSWSAIPIADFHALGRMLTAVFADAKGTVPPAKEKDARAGSAADGAGDKAKKPATPGTPGTPAKPGTP